ncbi:MAG: CCA tRNA nucleotidyltransferase [Ruminococcus sp.]|nr:CCA tRNA nucleotidyltransferase [Ruminococcus sp.]
MKNIPDKCKLIFNILENNGFECFAVGGCVRDSIMGNEPNDWDFTTNALPDDICRCFSDYPTIDIGREYGAICVVIDSEPFEITTYRFDGVYSDSRHPDSVSFSRNITEDLARRDFTINSIAYSESRGYVDPYNGIQDIKDGIIRCTGVASKRFGEDALRMLRAIRFAARFGFSVDPATKEAMLTLKDNLRAVHPQRIRKELTGILMADNVSHILRDYRDVIAVIIPEITPMFDLPQVNPHHCYDVWTHTLTALEHTPASELIRFAVFFHDIGKPCVKTTDDKGIDHFKKHQLISAQMTGDILRRFGFPNKFINKVCALIRHHDERFRLMGADIRRVLSDIGEDLFWKLMDVSLADMLGQSDYHRADKLAQRDAVIKEAHAIIARGDCYTLSQLKVKGPDLIAMGFKGEAIGHALNVLLRLVIKGKLANNRDELLLIAKSLPRE